jgi:hypothetical protein
MKTVVFGLFDELDDARRVLLQLTRSPLDLEGVSIVHADPRVQQDLAAEAGLPRRRGPVAAVVAGAVIGGALGAFLGGGVLAGLGPLLAAAGGLLVGGAFGLWIGVTADAIRIPAEHAEAATEALAAGATVVLVRTGSQPTARAIRELFVRSGSRVLPALAPEPSEVAGAGPTLPPDAHAAISPSLVASDTALVPPAPQRPTDPAHAMFAPPWRRTPSSVRVPPAAARAVEATEPEVVDPLLSPAIEVVPSAPASATLTSAVSSTAATSEPPPPAEPPAPAEPSLPGDATDVPASTDDQQA